MLREKKRAGMKQCDVCKRWFKAEFCPTSNKTGMTWCPVPEWHECVRPEDKEAS